MKGCLPLLFGLFFILIGLEIILKFFFKISLPLLKILFAFIFIYIGVSILIGKPLFRPCRCDYKWESSNAFGSFSYNLKDKEVATEKIAIVFGEKKIDLTGMKIKGEKALIKLDCVFGEMKVKLDENIPVRVSGTAVFGSLELPENKRAVFGSNQYESPDFSSDKPYLEIEASVVFGAVSFK